MSIVQSESPAARRVAVALSGGGNRACLFALGALLYLVDAGKGPHLSSVASVSGGSLANGAVAQDLDLTRAGPGDLDPTVARVSRRIVNRGTVFASRLAIAYVALLVAAAAAALLLPWYAPVETWGKIAIWVAALLLVAWLVSFRGKACAAAFDRTLFRPGGSSTRLDSVNEGLDHVFCATDLHAGEHVYFSPSFVCSYRFGTGVPGDVKLSEVVQASAAFPGAFPPAWLPTERHRFSGGAEAGAALARKMSLVDGGVYDNMADQWAQGLEARAKRPRPDGGEYRGAEELVVVNSSAGLGWSRLRGLRVPAIGELLTLLRDKSVLYDNGNSLRRQSLFARFELAEKTGEGMRGALVHIPQSPFKVPRAFSRAKGERGERAKAALAALETEGADAEARWAQDTTDNTREPTTLFAGDAKVAARLLHHGYLLAMANLHVLLGYPLLDPPDRERFAALARDEGH
jgi:predicted acylesterase/phospholipase RssA